MNVISPWLLCRLHGPQLVKTDKQLDMCVCNVTNTEGFVVGKKKDNDIHVQGEKVLYETTGEN